MVVDDSCTCEQCREIDAFTLAVLRSQASLWTCPAPCGWTNTSTDTTCQRCGAGHV